MHVERVDRKYYRTSNLYISWGWLKDISSGGSCGTDTHTYPFLGFFRSYLLPYGCDEPYDSKEIHLASSDQEDFPSASKNTSEILEIYGTWKSVATIIKSGVDIPKEGYKSN